jgi:hypothetical protein
MTPQSKTSLAVAIPIVLTALHFLAPKLETGDILAVLSGVLAVLQGAIGVANVFHVSAKVKGVLASMVAWANEVKADVPAPTGTMVEARRLADGAVKVPPLPVLLMLVVFVSGCISSAPVVPVTPANQAQVSSCESTAAAHNDVVIGGFVLGGVGAGLGTVGGLVSDPGQKTGLAIGAAVAGGVAGILAILSGFTAYNFANSHCSDVVGALPLGAKGPVQH